MITIEELNIKLQDEKYRPDYYADWNRIRETMFVHTRGKKPGVILTERRPNEDPEIKKYREMIYEPITKGSIQKAIDKLYRIFQNANFSIQVSDELDAYLSVKKFDENFFYGFIQKYVVPRMIEDPNGWLVWIPYGEGLINPSVKVDVEPLIISTDQIKYLDKHALTWLDVKNKSVIKKANKDVEEGKIYYTLTTEGFYRHVQYGDARKTQFRLELIYIHNIGSIPGCVMGGDLTAEKYFESYFSAFVPFANEAIRQYSDWQGVMTTSAFPYREEVGETCDAKGCRDGIIYNNDTEEHDVCKKCNGTGRIVSRSPFGVFIREKGNAAFNTDNNNEPLIRFISPPVDIIQYSGQAWEKLLEKAEDALHLTLIDEAQSGIAKAIDREDSFAQLTKISNNIFDEIIFRSLVYIEKYRNVVNPKDPIIIKPISFSMKTENDLIQEITQLTDRNAPVAFLIETTKDLARKRFSGNKAVARMVEVLVSYDPIYNLATKDKATMLASGVIKKEDIIRSLYAYKVMISIVAQNGTQFLESPLDIIFAALDQAMLPIIENYENEPIVDLGIANGAENEDEINRDVDSSDIGMS
jgi:hypothetical protein